MYEDDVKEINEGKTNWLTSIKIILEKTGFSHIWADRQINKPNLFIKNLKSKLKDIFEDQWMCELYYDKIDNPHEGNKLRTYRKFKYEFKLEPYLLLFTDRQTRIQLTKLRISAHNLQIEIGRHHKPNKLPLNERLCKHEHCDGKIEDEYHFIMECKNYDSARKTLLEKLYNTYPTLEGCDKDFIFWFLLQSYDADTCAYLIDFLKFTSGKRGAL